MSFCFISCGTEEPSVRNREVTRVIDSEPYASRTANPKSSSLATVYCTTPGTNCHEWVAQGDQVFLNRQQQVYNDFIYDYGKDSLSRFFSTDKWRDLFGDYHNVVSSTDVSKVVSGQYAVQLTEDGSIVIFKTNNTSLFTKDNVLFALKK